jgi:hypothetical protein
LNDSVAIGSLRGTPTGIHTPPYSINFFFSNTRECTYLCIRRIEYVYEIPFPALLLLRTTLYCIHSEVSPIRRISYAPASSRRPVAPASIHLSASVLMTCRISWIDAGDSLKHRALRSFHNCHETKANRESMPLRRSLVTMDRRRRHHESPMFGVGN